MTPGYIFDHVRTPRGKGRVDGALHEITPIQLASQVLAAIRERSQLDPAHVDDVILGCVTPVAEQGSDIARLAAIMAGYPESVPGIQVNRFCASGLDAVNMAAAQIACGQADGIVAGGIESMSRVPPMSDGGAWSNDPQVIWASYFAPTGVCADLLATIDGYTRADVDTYALESHRRAATAWDSGYFARSVQPVTDILGQEVLARDEHMRPGTTLDGLGTLKPAFDVIGDRGGFDAVVLQRYPMLESIRHIHTPGNSSGIVDGAAAVLLGSEEFGRRTGLKPRARVRSFASIGSEPAVMLTGPAIVTEKLLERAGMTAADIDLFEINEAFSSVVLRYMRALDIPHDRVNVNGGAIAMGHPLGATGAMLVGTVLDELERRGLGTAIVTLCAAAGMATATLIERV